MTDKLDTITRLLGETKKGSPIQPVIDKARAEVGTISAAEFESWLSTMMFTAQAAQMMGPQDFGDAEDLMIDEGRVLVALLDPAAKKSKGVASFLKSMSKEPAKTAFADPNKRYKPPAKGKERWVMIG